MIPLHAGRHLDGALLDHGEQFGRLAVTAERLQRHFDAAFGFFLDGFCERQQHLIVGRGVLGVDRTEAQHDVRSGRRREKPAARPSRAAAAEGILVRENILFPSSPSVVECRLAAPDGRMGGSLTGLDPNFCELIVGKP